MTKKPATSVAGSIGIIGLLFLIFILTFLWRAWVRRLACANPLPLEPDMMVSSHPARANLSTTRIVWKALEASGMYRAQKLAANLYYHELAKSLVKLGYEIESTKLGVEIKGLSPILIKRFSKRHEQINAQTEKRIEKDGPPKNVKDLREKIAHDGRRPKTKNATADNLLSSWADQMTAQENEALARLKPKELGQLKLVEGSHAVAWADEHLFERRSVAHDFELLSTVLAYGRGQGFDIDGLKRALDARGYVREKGKTCGRRTA